MTVDLLCEAIMGRLEAGQLEQAGAMHLELQRAVEGVVKTAEKRVDAIAGAVQKEAEESRTLAAAAVKQVQQLVETWMKEVERVKEREQELAMHLEARTSNGRAPRRLGAEQREKALEHVTSLSELVLDEVLGETVVLLQAQEQEARLKGALEGARRQEEHLQRLLAGLANEQLDIVSRATMLSLSAPPEATIALSLGDDIPLDAMLQTYSYSGIVHGGMPRDPDEGSHVSGEMVRRVQGAREGFYKALQEWESVLYDGSLNQWKVEDAIAADMLDEVLEGIAKELEGTMDGMVEALLATEVKGPEEY